MAVLAAAQLLDELMGRHRNVAPNEEIKETNWEDAEVSLLIFYYTIFSIITFICSIAVITW